MSPSETPSLEFIRCAKCGARATFGTLFCSNCGNNLTYQQNPQTVRDQAPRKRLTGSQIAGWICAGVVVFLAFVAYVAGPDRGPRSTTPSTPTEFDASATCEKLITERVRSPATIDFGRESDKTRTNIGTGTFRVVGQFDSQNGFGALIRTGYTCTLTYAGNNQWDINELRFDP